MAISQAPGMVRIQAHTTRPATPQRTADSRRLAPTPTMPPVIVCVVDTGMPACDVKNNVAAAADSAAIPPTGWSRVIFEPIVLTIRQPPVSVPERDRDVGRQHHPQRDVGAGRQVTRRDEHGEDHAHRLLGVVATVAEAERGGREQLPDPEAAVEPVDVAVAVDGPHHPDRQEHPERQPEQRGQDDEHADRPQPGRDEHVEAALGDGGAGDAADEGVRRARREAEVERDQVPSDGPDEPGEHHADREHVGVDDAGGDRRRDDRAEHEEGDEVEHRRPDDREPR